MYEETWGKQGGLMPQLPYDLVWHSEWYSDVIIEVLND